MWVAYVHASAPAATWAATCWACEQLPRYWKPVQLQRATPSRTVTSLNSPGLLLLAMRTTRSRGPSTAPRPRRARASRSSVSSNRPTERPGSTVAGSVRIDGSRRFYPRRDLGELIDETRDLGSVSTRHADQVYRACVYEYGFYDQARPTLGGSFVRGQVPNRSGRSV